MPTYLMGDVHGQLDKLLSLLRQSGLISQDSTWTGGRSSLYFLGDYFDRGPHGIKVVDLIMRLQVEAAMEGGRIEAILGNHDVMLLAAKRFGNVIPDGAELPLRYLWQQNGGRKADIDGLTEDRIAWLSDLPAMIQVGTTLLQHADATFYDDYGRTLDQINGSFADLLQCEDYDPWAELIVSFIRRLEFLQPADGTEAAHAYLLRHKVQSLVHGHTPIPLIAREMPGVVSNEPFLYADGQCTNIDGGLFLGEPGFIYELPAAG